METKSMSLSATVYLPIKSERRRKISDPTRIVWNLLDRPKTVVSEGYRANVILAALLCLLCSSILVFAQATSSDYTNDLPSVERVKAEIKGSDPTDTLARQVAVFTYLVSYIDRIKYNRTVSGDYTPGEQKMMGAYRLAAYPMSQ